MCSAKRSYQPALASAAAMILSTIGRRAASYARSAAGRSPVGSRRALARAMASSKARRVPEPMEKCAVWAASPTRTRLPADQRALVIRGNWRQIDRLAISGCPSSSRAKTRSQ